MGMSTRSTFHRVVLALSMTAALLSALVATTTVAAAPKEPKTPNILFFIMDDVGIDQMKVFGYGGATPPRTPNIDAVAHAGVRFRNAWAMPECSPSRAIFFEGRYPLRTNVFNAILALDLANSQVSPFETTTPLVLRKKGYEADCWQVSSVWLEQQSVWKQLVHALGWDYFAGFGRAPFPIDTTAGGVGTVDSSTGEGPILVALSPTRPTTQITVR